MRQHGPWKVHSTREIHSDPWVTLTLDIVTRPDGELGTFTVVRVKPGVSVLPVDADGTVCLGEEFRYAVGRPSLEVVSGAIDDGESPLDAAKRELKEELGIDATEWTDLGVIDPHTSMVAAPAHLFLAQRLSFGEQEQEGTEKIKPVRMRLADAVEAVMSGRITHGQSGLLILKAAMKLSGKRGA